MTVALLNVLTEQSAGSCAELECRYNAVCQLNNGVAECICPSSCHTTNLTLTVCGTDGLTYASACHLRLSACRLQKDTLVAHYGPCQGTRLENNAEPVRLSLLVDWSKFQEWYLMIAVRHVVI